MRPLLNATVRRLLAAAAIASLAACGSGDAETDAKSANVRVSLTDAAACGFDRVFVTVEKVRVHASASASELSAGWADIVVSPARRIDLLALNNGALEQLGQAPVAPGDYAQIRLVLRRNGNSVVPTGGLETPLQTSSAVETGIRIIRPFNVQANERADVVLDFDACRSIIERGVGSYSLEPVVTGHLIDASIEGVVEQTVADAVVSVQKNGAVIRSTVPDANTGVFRIPFLDSAQSPYEVVVTANGRSTAVIAGVPASRSAVTSVGTIPMPASTLAAPTGTASGTLNPVAAREIAEVRATQAVGVPAVEIAFRNVNSSTGVYTLTLPRDTPRLAAYSTTQPLTFTAQAASEGRYTLQARATGFAPRTEAVDLRTTNMTVNFTLDAVP
jgi:hypothetical protein